VRQAVYPSLPPAWRHSYEASVSLGMKGRHYPAWGLTRRRAVEPFRRALPAQRGNRIGADRGGQADLAAIRLAQT